MIDDMEGEVEDWREVVDRRKSSVSVVFALSSDCCADPVAFERKLRNVWRIISSSSSEI